MMRTLGSVAAVVAAIHEDAAAEVERLRQQTASILTPVPDEKDREAAHDVGAPDAETRRAAARREARERIARDEWLGARDVLEVREAWIARAVQEGQRLMAADEAPTERRALLGAFVREALRHLPGEAFDVIVSPGDAPILDPSWCREVAAARRPNGAPLDIRVVPGAVGGGCQVCTRDGRTLIDQTFDARARRLEPVWRAELGRLYQRALAALSPIGRAQSSQ